MRESIAKRSDETKRAELRVFLRAFAQHNGSLPSVAEMFEQRRDKGGAVTTTGTGNPRQLSGITESERRALTLAKAAVAAGGVEALPENFLWRESLQALTKLLIGKSAFETVLSLGVRAPLHTLIAASAVSAVADEVGEGAPIPVTSSTFSDVALAPRKIAALLALSEDLLRKPNAGALIERGLSRALAEAQDRIFLAGIAGSPVATSAGSGAANALADIKTALQAVAIAGGSPLLVLSSGNATAASCFDSLPFAKLSPEGGLIAGVPAIVSDEVPTSSGGSSLVAIDANAMLAGSDVPTLDTSKAAALQMDDSPNAGPQALVSMFQTNAVALKLGRTIGFEKIRDGAVAVISGVEW